MFRILMLNVVSLLAAGCAVTTADQPVGRDHPASPEAASLPMPPSEGTLSQAARSGNPSTESPTSMPKDMAAMPGMTGMGQTATPLAGATSGPSASAAYACPMHPEVTSDKPGKCPKCGMKLVAKGGE